MDDKIMVSVVMLAYNHERYIREALESVLAQKADFTMEILIHDDASTDRTAMIIKEYEDRYPNIIKAVYEKENQWSKNLYHFKKMIFNEKIKGKYFALCEGDDYWTDDGKLQKQIDFLETHPEHSMCMSNALVLNTGTGEVKPMNTFPVEGTYSQEEQIKAGLGSSFPATASFVFRTEFLKDMPDFFYECGPFDYPLRQYYADRGSVYYFEKPMTVYRTAVSDSYMSRIKEDVAFYNDYTVGTIIFFEKFNDYTEQKFDHILADKIISDYLGFCLSIEYKEGLAKAAAAGLDMDKIAACYDCLSVDHVKRCILDLEDATDHLFIYGASKLAIVCKNRLKEAGIDFEGFVVTDGQTKPEQVEGERVFYLSEAIKLYAHPGFLLAIQPVNEEVILDILKKYNVVNYGNPYALKNYRH